MLSDPGSVLQRSVRPSGVSASCCLPGALLELRVPCPQGAFLSTAGHVVRVGMDGGQAWIRGLRERGASAGCGSVRVRGGGRHARLVG